MDKIRPGYVVIICVFIDNRGKIGGRRRIHKLMLRESLQNLEIVLAFRERRRTFAKHAYTCVDPHEPVAVERIDGGCLLDHEYFFVPNEIQIDAGTMDRMDPHFGSVFVSIEILDLTFDEIGG